MGNVYCCGNFNWCDIPIVIFIGRCGSKGYYVFKIDYFALIYFLPKVNFHKILYKIKTRVCLKIYFEINKLLYST